MSTLIIPAMVSRDVVHHIFTAESGEMAALDISKQESKEDKDLNYKVTFVFKKSGIGLGWEVYFDEDEDFLWYGLKTTEVTMQPSAISTIKVTDRCQDSECIGHIWVNLSRRFLL